MKNECRVHDCTSKGGTKGLCPKHYQELRRKGLLVVSDSEVLQRKLTPCAAEGCSEGAITQGMCGTHYSRWLRHGDPRFASDPNRPKKTAKQAFRKRVLRTEGCWLWTGHIDEYGKGRFSFGGKQEAAHRYAYAHHYGVSLTSNDVIRQTCKVPQCVNPRHLLLVSAGRAAA